MPDAEYQQITKTKWITCKKSGQYKVRDHCHYTGKYLGAAHSICNFNRKNFQPVFFHHLSGYDIHLFIKDLAATDSTVRNGINCIPNREEKYILVSKYIVVNNKKRSKFIDTFKFMSASLETLSTKLMPEQFVKCNKLL